MKKVAIVINTSWNIYNFRLNLVKALQAEGMQVYAVAPTDPWSARLEENGCTFCPLKMEGSGANPFVELDTIRQLYQAYRKIKPDVVLHYTIKPNLYGSVAAKALGIPCINNVSGLGTAFLSNSVVAQLARRLYRVAFRFPEKVFFQNKDDWQLFLKMKLVKQEKSDVIPGSGVDTSRFTPTEKPAGQEFIFLLIARLLIDKGIVEYVEAVKLLKEKGIRARFQLLGASDPTHRRGIPAETLKSWVEDGMVEYLGTTDDVLPFIQDANCIVLPSYREGTPRTLLEGASCGKPLVATNVAGCNNVVKDGYNGFLCQVKDSVDLAKRMEQLHALAPEKRAEMGRNSRLFVQENFDEKLVIQRYIMAIQEIAG